MTNDEKRKISFRLSRFAHVLPSAVEITDEVAVTGRERKVFATVKGRKMGALLEGEFILSMWYVV